MLKFGKMEKIKRKEAEIGNATPSKELVKNLCSFNRMPECCCPLPELNSSENHNVLFNTNIVAGVAPEVSPDTLVDKWDDDHVWMPHSSHNIITVKEKDGKEKQMNGWEVITNALSRSIKSVKELEDAISTYAKPYGYSGNLNRLTAVVEKEFNKEEREDFYSTTLPAVIKLALQLPSLFNQPIPLLKEGTQHMITISQKQIACLLANAFLSTFPKRSQSTYNPVHFTLLSSMNIVSPFRDHRPVEKIKCILNYFRRVTAEEPTGTVTFQRKCLIKPPNWSSSNNNFCNLSMQEAGTIENEGSSMLQVDFADEYIGGLVLQSECAQEEVLFIVSPELIVAILFTEKLEDKETLLVTGCERYNVYSGYEHTFKWEGDFYDKTPRDAWGRKYIQMIAMDALCSSGLNQYRPSIIERELNKAFCGFSEPNLKPQNLPAIASGKWGCGVFGGEPKLKSLIQLMAAAEARRDLVLFTFYDHQLKQEVESLYNVLQNKEVTVGGLWKLLKKYYEEVILNYNGNAILPLYDFVCKEL